MFTHFLIALTSCQPNKRNKTIQQFCFGPLQPPPGPLGVPGTQFAATAQTDLCALRNMRGPASPGQLHIRPPALPIPDYLASIKDNLVLSSRPPVSVRTNYRLALGHHAWFLHWQK